MFLPEVWTVLIEERITVYLSARRPHVIKHPVGYRYSSLLVDNLHLSQLAPVFDVFIYKLPAQSREQGRTRPSVI